MKKKSLHLLGADSAIFSEKVGRLKFSPLQDSEDDNSKTRSKAFAFLVFAIVFVFFIRLFYLQVVVGSKNRALADEPLNCVVSGCAKLLDDPQLLKKVAISKI